MKYETVLVWHSWEKKPNKHTKDAYPAWYKKMSLSFLIGSAWIIVKQEIYIYELH